ncbi:Serine/threonine-protein kinase [Rhynchospora pubera]|uniref:Receptor-like serine/threonine-protein kinase n=1 Tax=Rhynchospora pubera TaxID=906938 RepID=A0AAV8GVF8_9POAL|nr:Serine/threonine-protein kinase [Rhynchospora pubera]
MVPSPLKSVSLFLCLLPLLAASADIPLGSIITPLNSSSLWTSPSETFSLSFVSSQASPILYYPAISYSSVPIWNPPGPPLVDSGGSLRLLLSGNLVLVNSSGNTLWETSTSALGVTSASLLDTGNLLLKNSSSTLWQSFQHPTDTILQDQNFTFGQTLTSNSYSFSLLQSGNLTLKFNNSIQYFNNGYNATYNRNITSPVLTLKTNGIVQIYDGSLNSTVVIAYSDNYAESDDMLRFLRLDNDGNFRAYSAARGSSVPTAHWSAVTEQCDVFGYCGNYGVCTYNDSSPYCICPSRNFEFVDPANPRNGCKRTKDLNECLSNSTMLELNNTQFLTYPPEVSSQQYFVGLTACRQNCLSGGSCVASTALGDGSGLCYLKVTNFVSAYQSATLPSTSYVKVCPPALPNPPRSGSGSNGGSSKIRSWVVVVVVAGTIFGLVALEWGLWWCFCRNSPKFGGSSSSQYALLEYASGAPVQFSYKELHRSTKGFKERLGSGGFGTVYRGLVNHIPVAVKRLEGIEQGEKQFRMEVATISSTHHLNLVRLIGFCSEGRHRLLVYEFMKNGSLDAYLFGDGKHLPWPIRFNIAIGTARGVTYLHEECCDCIVHCDIKPENILLDDNFNAKVSDFGLARLISAKDHRNRTLTSVRGTRGYLAPEWLANLPITSKSDVYSYGMVLLELISGRRNFDVSEGTSRKKFSLWAFEEFERGDIAKILDQRVVSVDLDMEQIERALKVCFWCIQEQPSMRPSMGKVVQMLEGIMQVERPPPPRVPLETSLNVTGGDDGEVTRSFLPFAAPAPGAPAQSDPAMELALVKGDEADQSS